MNNLFWIILLLRKQKYSNNDKLVFVIKLNWNRSTNVFCVTFLIENDEKKFAKIDAYKIVH